MSVSPNTVYPLLRRLEEKGYLVGEWEDPDAGTRRFYTIIARGEENYEEMKGRFEGHRGFAGGDLWSVVRGWS